LPHTRFHDLRHLNAAVMLKLSVPDKYALERGGWSTSHTKERLSAQIQRRAEGGG
jgi:hypothetical protein